MQLSYEDWKRQYNPILNHLNPNASYDGLLFETYGDEIAFIIGQPQNTVWTLLDCDGKLILGSGFHVVNRMGYVVTEVPVPEGVDIGVVDVDDNPNENCLEGMACPECGDFGPFKILASQVGMTRVSDEGTDSIEGDVEWEDDSPCECLECGHTAKVGQFKGQPDPVFDTFQQVVIESYNGGDHTAHAPGDIHDCGDTLLTFLLVELSKREDCDSFGCAVQRLDSAIRQLTEMRAAFEAKALEIGPLGVDVKQVTTTINRRPFQVTDDGFVVNGRICLEIAVADALPGEYRQQAEDATNDRFEQMLANSEATFGVIDERKYRALVDSFIETVVKSCCKAGEPA